MPIQDKLEMGMTLDAVETRLQLDPRYGDMMQRAFGDREVNRERIARALAQFVRSIVSYRTKFDTGLAQATSIDDDFPSYSKLENHGKSIFLGAGNCATCHMGNGRGGPGPAPGGRGRRGRSASGLFVTPQVGNNGLDMKIKGNDKGVGGVTGRSDDIGKFKVPSLRNIAKTAPYMHAGRLKTLRAVIDHYNRGIKDHPNLDRRLRRGGRGGGLGLTIKDRSALIAFLETLTDHELAKDERFSDPFRKAR